MLKQQQQLKQQQKLSPQQIQAIKILEIPAMELDERINDELIDNPALELGEEEKEEDRIKSAEEEEIANIETSITETYSSKSYNTNDSDDNYYKEQSDTGSFIEDLKQQLQTFELSDKLRTIAEYIIGTLDPDGYLRRETSQIADDLLIYNGIDVSLEEIEHCVSIIQGLEPAGIGARTLQESLTIQLNAIDDNENTVLAREIVDKHFDLLGRRAYDTIAKRTNHVIEDVQQAIVLIRHLNPKPGNTYSNSSPSLNQTITPDFRVNNYNGSISVELITSRIPELRVSQQYKDMVEDFNSNSKNQTTANRNAMQFAQQKIDSARWFIEAIKVRNNTLLTTMKAIVEIQKDYFLIGDDIALKPMRLKDVADKVDLDISTISRVSNSKYVETDWGIISLKHFFSEAMEHSSGTDVSNKEIKRIIRDIIENENKKKPRTDEDIAAKLNEKGYSIARRTVAKYREGMNIPIARQRKM